MAIYADTFIADKLSSFGLSPKETSVYLACLHRGEISVIELARITNLSRSTAYFIADQLIQRGLLRFIQKGAHRIYAAEDPRKLATLLEEQAEQLARNKHVLSEILPSLNMQFTGAANKPLVSYYVGQIEMRQIFEDALISGIKELLFVGEMPVLVQAVGPEFMASWNRRKVKAKIKTRGIWPSEASEFEESFLKPTPENLREARYAPKGFRSPTYVLLYANKVAFISSIAEAYGTLIESKDLSITMNHWFDALWASSSTKR